MNLLVKNIKFSGFEEEKSYAIGRMLLPIELVNDKRLYEDNEPYNIIQTYIRSRLFFGSTEITYTFVTLQHECIQEKDAEAFIQPFDADLHDEAYIDHDYSKRQEYNVYLNFPRTFFVEVTDELQAEYRNMATIDSEKALIEQCIFDQLMTYLPMIITVAE